jgi:hypothetical protein
MFPEMVLVLPPDEVKIPPPLVAEFPMNVFAAISIPPPPPFPTVMPPPIPTTMSIANKNVVGDSRGAVCT